MAFVSYTYKHHEPATNQYLYTIVDSEFGAVDVGVGVGVGGGVGFGGGVAVAKEYSKRGLPVGKNLALFVIYYHKDRRHSIANIKRWQDQYCPKYIENWDMYAKERDAHLEKLSALL